MVITQNKFTVHPEYENFKLGTSKLIFDTLIPYRHKMETQGGSVFALLFSLFMLLVAIGMGIVLYVTLIVPFMLDHYRQETPGRVVDCYLQERKIGLVPIITYEFIWDNKIYSDEASIVGDTGRDCSPYQNKSLTIMLLPSQPEHSFPTIAQSNYAKLQQFSMVFASVFLYSGSLFFVIMYVYGLYTYWRANWAYPRLQNGILLEGKIERIKGDMGYKPRVFLVSVTYSFETPAKHRLKGWTQVVREDLENNVPPVGTPVTILYADDHAYTLL